MAIIIIAEIGINHNGDMSICKELIDVAKNAGCDAVKFQKRDINIVYTKEFLDEPRKSPWGKTQRDQKLGLEFDLEGYKEIDRHCNEKKIDWFASAWDLNSQDFLHKFNLKYNKVASVMIVFEKLLKKIAEEGKHTFISTGMSTYDDIDKAVKIFRKANCPFELMHTVSTYPMKYENANLNIINTLKNRFKCNVGYSGHEVGLVPSFAASALGISSLERHITLDRSMYGSDQAASVEPVGFRRLIEGVRVIEKCLGIGEKKVINEEIPIAKKLRAHLEWESER